MNKLLNNLLGMYKQAKLNKKAEQQNLKQIFEEAMGNREPIIETANGVFYFEPKGDKIVFGTATNVGIFALPNILYSLYATGTTGPKSHASISSIKHG